ncbi:hypothetical protein FDP41_011106 [Naegleria fowleri]|uniref:EF-hand domain-containing protein n=1 Tax=Naegleria fowleri TaxID=5763 RepID=A0A6A5CC60_NAEFO|nr:uncharacterized protein FDP41_011637 [Naegleria fowleri]XP_044567841.1 uncharacterized protein FDP41_011106 [Naegleria fowleri]KAF0982232.1 hypothetical protein FDP41_011637 [Naegleria fowleri]KAF0983128.1 hypothetical protein FDP41_011106 [Naegleria fowleri]CAG4715353.1 unnamed protein product [Naegleria fowleri]
MGRHHHHHHHRGHVGAGLVGLGLGLLGGAVIASAVSNTHSSPTTVTTTTIPSSCSVFWHGTCPRWIPVGFVVPQHFYTYRSTWISQAQSLFYQHTMFGANYLNKRGFKRAMACLGLHKHQAKHLFFMMDTDRNGVITLDEFINAYLFVMSGGMTYKGTGFMGMSGVIYPTSFALNVQVQPPQQQVTTTTSTYHTTNTPNTTCNYQPPMPPGYQQHPQPVVTSTVYYQQPQQQQQQPGYYQPPPYQPPFNPQSAYLPQSQPQYVATTQVYQQPQQYISQTSVPSQNQIYQQPNTFN